MITEFHLSALLSALLFAFLGLILFVAAFKVVVKMALATFREEIIERNNIALAILAGAVSLGLSIIVAAAVH